jgi:hypothetical protein
VRCGDVAEPMGADIDHVPAVEGPRRAVGEIDDIDLATYPPRTWLSACETIGNSRRGRV